MSDFGKMMQGFLEKKGAAFLDFGIKVLLILLFFWIGHKVIRWIRKLIRLSLERSEVDAGVRQFVDSFLKYGLYILLIVTIATNLGIESTSIAALLASGGVGISLALQGSLSNFAGGILILILKPFVVGDYIIEDTNKNEGTVKEIQIFYTKLATVDNKIVVIPNGILSNNSLTNLTHCELRQLDLQVDIAYGADLKKAKVILETILEEEEGILEEQEKKVFVRELGASSVVLGVRGWVKTEAYWEVRWRILEHIKLELDAQGIEIPFQQLQVHFEKDGSLAESKM